MTGRPRRRRTAAWLAVAILASACTSPRERTPQVRELYATTALRSARNPVVVIHGILGARLEQRSTGRTVWGAFTSEAVDPNSPDGARALALPLSVPDALHALPREVADVVATGPLRAIQLGLVFTVINVGVYVDILRSLGVGGYRDRIVLDPSSPEYAEDHFTCETFFYDWRRDNVENAMAFGQYLDATRRGIEARARSRIEKLRREGGPDAEREAAELEQWLADGFRFDVVAHSMGGLMARYFLRYGAQDLPADGSLPKVTWAGAEWIDRMVLVGTPNLGAMDSLRTLVEGFSPGLFLPHFDAALLGTMPSIYQLLPRGGQGLVVDEDGKELDVDPRDPALWRDNGWGLAAPGSERYVDWLLPDLEPAARRERALAVQAAHLERARRFHAALDQDPGSPCPAEMRLFAADTLPTLARMRLVRRGERLVPSFSGSDLHEFGDGTVTRYSALADRGFGTGAGVGWLDGPVRWTGVTFLPDDHIGLTRNPLFTDNLLFHLLQQAPLRR